jgi:hypothetical protein
VTPQRIPNNQQQANQQANQQAHLVSCCGLLL